MITKSSVPPAEVFPTREAEPARIPESHEAPGTRPDNFATAMTHAMTSRSTPGSRFQETNSNAHSGRVGAGHPPAHRPVSERKDKAEARQSRTPDTQARKMPANAARNAEPQHPGPENPDAARSGDDDSSDSQSRDTTNSADGNNVAVQKNPGPTPVSDVLTGIALALAAQLPAPTEKLQGCGTESLAGDGTADDAPAAVTLGQTPSNSASLLPGMQPITPANVTTNLAAALAAVKSTDAKPAPKPDGNASSVKEQIATPTDAGLAPPLAAAANAEISPQTGLNTGVIPNGTAAALNKQRMKSSSEKNEIAGHTVQKLPRVAVNGTSSDDSSELADSTLPVDAEHKKDSAIPITFVNAPDKSALPDLTVGAPVDASPSSDRSASQAERLGHLITREVVMIRQSGANTLAVSVKLDSNTELFLQLTNHGGQLQASVRCERGTLAGLEGHWAQLQESLSRHNVQLLPPEGTSSSRNTAFHTPFDPGADRQAGQQSTSQNRQRASDLREDLSPADPAVAPGRSRKTTKPASARQGWESWA